MVGGTPGHESTMAAAQQVKDSAEDAAREVHDSRVVEVMARSGLASRATVWLVIALLAASIAVGSPTGEADQTGALAAIAEQPLGGFVLVVVALGFFGYAVWQLLSAAVGHRDREGWKLVGERALSLGVGVTYAFLCVSTVLFLLRGSGGDQTASRTAELMSRPGGRTAVGLVGAALVVGGLVVGVRALMAKHSERLEDYRVPDRLRRPVTVLGAVGLAGHGAVAVLLGVFVLRAALQFDPDEAKGLDAALQALAQQPYGRAMLAATVVGMLAYSAWSYAEAAYREV